MVRRRPKCASYIDPLFLQAPRGLSAEEKRVKLLEIFHETVGFVIFLVHSYPGYLTPSAEGLLSGEFLVTLLSKSCGTGNELRDTPIAKGAGEARAQNEGNR